MIIKTKNSVYTLTQIGKGLILTSTNPKYAGPIEVLSMNVEVGYKALFYRFRHGGIPNVIITSKVVEVKK